MHHAVKYLLSYLYFSKVSCLTFWLHVLWHWDYLCIRSDAWLVAVGPGCATDIGG